MTANISKIRNLTYGEPIDPRRCSSYCDPGTVILIIDDPGITYVEARTALQNSNHFGKDQLSDCPFDAMRQKEPPSSNIMSDDSTQHQQSLIIEAHYINLNVCFTVLEEADKYDGYLPLQIVRPNNAAEDVSYIVQVKVSTPVPMNPRYSIVSLKDGPLGDPRKIQHDSAKAMLAFLYESRPKNLSRSKPVNKPAWENPLVDVIPEYDIPERINDDDEKNDIPLFNGNFTFILDTTIQARLTYLTGSIIELYGNSYRLDSLPRKCFLYCKSCKSLDLHPEGILCPSV